MPKVEHQAAECQENLNITGKESYFYQNTLSVQFRQHIHGSIQIIT